MGPAYPRQNYQPLKHQPRPAAAHAHFPICPDDRDSARAGRLRSFSTFEQHQKKHYNRTRRFIYTVAHVT
ncbi:hypothetical protein CLAIMM_07874 [Cladophialophora immunda]|nr:hypothetical protein CLAIMM_07874 [Cladophialophora immunda]